VDVVGIAADNEGLTAEFIAGTAEVVVEFCFVWGMDELLAVLGTEDDVDVVFY